MTKRMDSGLVTRDTLERVPEGVRRRDPAALGEFFELHFDRLYNVAIRMLNDHALAEDVLQEVFLKVHRAADRLDPDRDPRPWLATLTRNACREQWRRRGRRVEQRARSFEDRPALRETLRDGREGPEDTTLRTERDRTISNALMKLSVRLREVVVLHDYHGLAHEEIARVVGAKSSTVRKRYSRAMAELRRSLRGILE